MYQDLLKAFQHSQTIVVDLSNVTSMDTSIIQLICSAFKEALAEKKEFHLIGTIQPLLQTALVRYGFIMQEEPTGEALEKQWCIQTKGSL